MTAGSLDSRPMALESSLQNWPGINLSRYHRLQDSPDDTMGCRKASYSKEYGVDLIILLSYSQMSSRPILI